MNQIRIQAFNHGHQLKFATGVDGLRPVVLGCHFGYDEPRVIRRIDELAGLKNGWHFGGGTAPSSSVLAVAKVVASYALSRRLPDINAFPGKNGEVTIAIYLGEEDHSFQVRQNLSFRYWSESNPDSEVEEGLSFRDVIQKIDVIARAQPSWNLPAVRNYYFRMWRSARVQGSRGVTLFFHWLRG